MKEKIPLTIGIIGHRDALVTPQHQEIISNFFVDLQNKYPHSPFCLFSQLAAGADTIVAELFLEFKKNSKHKHELIVPLPLEIETYKTYFDGVQKAKFESLLEQSSKHFVIRHTQEHHEDYLYRMGGKFVADSSIILLVLWDGNANGKMGGTSDLVNYKMEGTFDKGSFVSLFDLKGFPLIIPCERESNASQKTIKLSKEPLVDILRITKKSKNHHKNKQDSLELQNEYNNKKSINQALQKIEELNAGIDRLPVKALTSSAKYLYPNQSKELNLTDNLVKQYYTVTDALAIYRQKIYYKIIDWLFVLCPIAFYLFDSYKESGDKIFYILVIILIIIISGVLIYSTFSRHHFKFLENRVLAEVLRVQFFWKIANVKEKVSDNILRIHNFEFNWIKHILLAINGLGYSNEQSNISLEKITDFWLVDQQAYFKKKILTIEKKLKRFDLFIKLIFAVGLLLIFSLYFFETNASKQLITLLFAAVAISKAYMTKKGHDQTLNQYSLMQNIFDKTIQKINEIETSNTQAENKNNAIRHLFYLVGREALIENGNWYLIFKKKQPEIEMG